MSTVDITCGRPCRAVAKRLMHRRRQWTRPNNGVCACSWVAARE